MMQSSHSGVFPSYKAVNELVRDNSSFLYRFDAESTLKSVVGEMSFVKRVYGHTSLSGEVKSSFHRSYFYNSFEGLLSRGFTDGKIYGLLSVGYRIGHYNDKEQWLIFSTGTGYIPAPYGIETSITYYNPLTQDRCARIRAEIYGLYRVHAKSQYFDFGLQTSMYIIPSGEYGSSPDATGYTQSDPLIEEFWQIEGGIIFRYSFSERFIFKLLVTNVLFINQKTYITTDPDTGATDQKYGTDLAYAPRVLLGLVFKL